jgi:hypothetical protein
MPLNRKATLTDHSSEFLFPARRYSAAQLVEEIQQKCHVHRWARLPRRQVGRIPQNMSRQGENPNLQTILGRAALAQAIGQELSGRISSRSAYLRSSCRWRARSNVSGRIPLLEPQPSQGSGGIDDPWNGVKSNHRTISIRFSFLRFESLQPS